MRSPKIVVTDSVFPSLDLAREVLSSIGGELKILDAPTPEAILTSCRDADAVLVTYAPIPKEAIRNMTRCRIIARFGIGVDNVDIDSATEAGILVTNVPDYCIDEVSDHTMALVLALIRKVTFASTRTHTGLWEMAAVVPIKRLRGSVLGLVGFGRIAQLVARKAQTFGINVIAYDPYVKPELLQQAGVAGISFDDLLRSSDCISLHAPLAAATRHLFGTKAFRRMKPTCYLVNTARGPLIDEAALVYALNHGELAGAALDVLEHEPPSDSPLFGRDNVIVTPHMSFYSVESLEELQTRAAQEVARVLSGNLPHNPVNPLVLNQ